MTKLGVGIWELFRSIRLIRSIRNFIFMLARCFRLKKRDIGRVYKKAQRINQDFLLVRFMPNTAKSSRFAVVIPKSVVKGSVGRSRLKRKTHEALQEFRAILKQNYDIILSFRKEPDEKDIAPVLKEILTNIN